MSRPAPDSASWQAFALWTGVGLALSLGVLAVFSVGNAILVPTIFAATLLAGWLGVGASTWGVVDGAALILWYVAFATLAGAVFAAGIAMSAVGLVAFLRARRTSTAANARRLDRERPFES